MCGLDYETILNPQQTPKNTKSLEDGAKDQEFVKAMKGPGGYFREPGGIINSLIFLITCGRSFMVLVCGI